MKNQHQFIKVIGSPSKSHTRSTCRRHGFVASLIMAWFAIAPAAWSVCRDDCGIINPSNTYQGTDAFLNNVSGADDTAIGSQTLYNNTSGQLNTAVGSQALYSNTTADLNTAVGAQALYSNLTGELNTAVGTSALQNSDADQNTAIGYHALNGNTEGSENTATGAFSLTNNQTGYGNSGFGFQALVANVDGVQNTACGSMALDDNTSGSNNTALGYAALLSNDTGSENIAVGRGALFSNVAGGKNTVIGTEALIAGTGSNNIALGFEAGLNVTAGDDNIDIGNEGVDIDSGTIRIGTETSHQATFIAGIKGTAIGSAVPVAINKNGRLGTKSSSARFKENIKPMNQVSEAILKLEPVTFRYKHELSPEGTPEFGLVAEQVEKVNPDLVVRDEQGKPFTVRYEAVNAMLLNEFLKAYATITELKSVVAKQQEQITALASQMKTVSNRLELSENAPRVAASEP